MVRAVLIGLLLIVLFLPQQIFAHSKVQIIEMTPNGFTPDPVTVDENVTIIFVNNDTRPRWPASNVHPTHDLYPEFDPKRPIAPGESWPFKPRKVGMWRYHDHLSPHIRGILVIKKESQGSGGGAKQESASKPTLFDTAKNTLSQLLMRVRGIFAPVTKQTQVQIKSPPLRDFLHLSPEKQTAVITSLGEQNPQQAWQYVKDAFKGKAGSSGNIHDLAHLAGNLLYKKMGFSGIGSCSREFAFGCYHGFLDAAFAKSLDGLSDAHDACLKLDPKNSAANPQGRQDQSAQVSGPAASCIHGIGHGVASYYLAKDLSSSLRACRKLITGREYCFDGVFMEFVRSAPDSFYNREDPLYPCNKLEKEYGYAYSFTCGRNQPSLLMSRFHMGFDEVVQICLASDSTPFKEACVDSLGFSLAATGEVEKVIQGCQTINDAEFQKRCLQAAAGEMVFQEVANWWEKSQAVCKAEEALSTECLDYVEQLITEYGKVKKQ